MPKKPKPTAGNDFGDPRPASSSSSSQQPSQPDQQQEKDQDRESETRGEPSWGTASSHLEHLSTLQILDLISHQVPYETGMRRDFLYLRGRIEEIEVINEQAREAVEKLDAVVTKLSSPANRVGTLLGLPKTDIALVMCGGEFYCTIDPRMHHSKLLIGTRLLLNEAYAVVGDLGFEAGGAVAKIHDILPDGRIRLGSDTGLQNSVVLRSTPLLKEKLKAGLEVRLDSTGRVALEVVASAANRDHLLETVPEIPWEKVGGQDEARNAVRDAIELPLLHPELFKAYKHSTPKGILLYGPPGCGKTLIGKATAYNLTKQLREKMGEDKQEYFMHVKGPEILNMWVGESERQVREIFARAREKAREGYLPFIFIDEAESILGTRRAGRASNILSTLVPMFCAEMDGIESLHEMVIILASNRADLIDPAILRPGRIDRKVKVNRPTRAEAEKIYRIYLTPDLPFAEKLVAEHGSGNSNGGQTEKNAGAVIDYLVKELMEAQFSKRDSNRFLEVFTRSGRREYLYRGDLISGAIISSIVERAKERAIKRAIAHPEENGLSMEDLLYALDHEYQENDIFPPSDITEDWLKLVDYDPENVVRISPVKPRRAEVSSIV
ncbi:MAG TPA: AAA family ATPase [Candidatus Methylacidiphilales bacterium]|nr:AAA family ATPase [Candidatus Methylacidiphilales bacterium]